MDKKSIKEKAESDLLWQMAMVRYFTAVGLCAHLNILSATPAIEFKKKEMDKIIKKLKALEEE